MPRHDATLRQNKASRPDRSTWLSANAGSGKTTVLTDRVARLLLEQVDAQHILCLTYTKAAATEMQNRLFKRLGFWAMLPDDALRMELSTLGYQGLTTQETLSRARVLFASAIETPGGLKIQTIHSFCSALLRRFPLEAGVTPHFTEIEDRAAKLLRAEIVEQIASSPEAERLYGLARYHTGETLDALTAEIVRTRQAFTPGFSDSDIAGIFGQPETLTEEDITASVFLGTEDAILAELVPLLRTGSSVDQRNADKLAGLTALDISALPILEGVFLLGKDAKNPFQAKTGSFPKQEFQKVVSHLLPALDAWMTRVEDAREPRLALAAMQKTRALHDFARVFLPAYARAKQLRGWLDFDDLILRARDLLSDPAVADWVLYKLDGGIDHILVDEAQDTSPVQWQVIESLAREFSSGEGVRPDVNRTIFVVGDKKQSIYSFQGADPREFDRMKADFARRLSDVGAPLQDMEMEFSFRSSPAILKVVDAVFQDHEESGFAQKQAHIAFKSNMPGRVDLWPLIEKPEKQEDPEWFRPVDIRLENDPATLLAQQVATAVATMIGLPLPDETGQAARPITPGDFLILVQRRSAVFHEIIRECKRRDLPVAGADRLRVGAELAVRDISALLSFLAMPDDSLALATALRSPLFGWSEAGLFGLAQPRKSEPLWTELRERAAEFPETVAILTDLRDKTDYLRPYELIERILTRHNGRQNLLSRLGPEAEDGIDAMLSQAMAYEQSAVDSLTGFLVWLEADELEIKRQMDSGGDRIRVMTVHGAKGLESPIVILPDTAKRPIQIRDDLARTETGVVWRTSVENAPAALRTLDQSAKAAQQAERDRLLYVAMTRAETWLIAAAAGETDKNERCWHDMIRTGLERVGAVPLKAPNGPGMRYEFGDWTDLKTQNRKDGDAQQPDLPGFYREVSPTPPPRPATLNPSDLGGAKTLPGELGLDTETAQRRGRLMHRLLEFLPASAEAGWPDTARHLIASSPDKIDESETRALIFEATRILSSPSLKRIFAASTLAEIPVSASLDVLNGRRIHGVIDRLVVEPNRVLAVDFKTNAVVPDTPADVPDGLLRQMGAYAHALMQIYPNRRVETALLWTRTATLMPLPHDLVTDALLATTIA